MRRVFEGSDVDVLIVIVIQVLMTFFAALALFLVVRAVVRGPEFIAASNRDFESRHFDRVRFSIWEIYCFRATPIALLIIGAWAGFAVFSGLFWFLNGFGRVDEFGDWASFREILASVVGVPTGAFFSHWMVKTCERVWVQTLQNAEIAPADWLTYELEGRRGSRPGR